MMVHVSPHNTGGGSRTYHTDSDCHYVGDRHREWPLDRAKDWDYTPCHKCAQKVEA